MHKFVKRSFLAVSALALFATSRDSTAATTPANLEVSSSITATCTISTAAVAFGAYDPIVTNLSAPLDGTGSVTTTCSTGAAPFITLGQGANAFTGSTEATPLRQMANEGAARMQYFLYQEVGRSTAWGNTVATAPPTVPGTGAAQVFTVYGRVTQGQNLPVAVSYADTVVATVNF
jgi:spore coat protein U-like protein